MTLPDGFTARTRPMTDCIIWTGSVTSRGYGSFSIHSTSFLAHRMAWEDVHGPIPDGMTIDHLCRVRNCINVSHLEMVTRAENIRRARPLLVRGECWKGHPIRSEDDINTRPSGHRECRECYRMRLAKYAEKRRIEREASP